MSTLLTGPAPTPPVWRVDTPVPLSLTRSGVVGPKVIPQPLTRSGSVDGARPGMSEIRSTSVNAG
ncbi:MAG TPA: hypothetical protein VIS06_03395 [Mycobacteriales bacterium]